MNENLFDIPVKTIDGKETTLRDYKGKTLLIVNVASKCGLTPQYQELENIYQKYKDQGFTVLGFPANDFGSQEPGSNQDIQQFCSLTYGVSFPMFEKIVVTDEESHPLYKTLTSLRPQAKNIDEDFEAKLKTYGHTRKGPGGILWNFEKFLVNKKGEVVERFSPNVKPGDEMVTRAIENVLKDQR